MRVETEASRLRLAEASGPQLTGRPRAQEIDQLLKMFRVLGTPNEAVWPGVLDLEDFKVEFPKWSPQDFSQVLPHLSTGDRGCRPPSKHGAPHWRSGLHACTFMPAFWILGRPRSRAPPDFTQVAPVYWPGSMRGKHWVSREPCGLAAHHCPRLLDGMLQGVCPGAGHRLSASVAQGEERRTGACRTLHRTWCLRLSCTQLLAGDRRA